MKARKTTLWLTAVALVGSGGAAYAQGNNAAPVAGDAPTVVLRRSSGLVTLNASGTAMNDVLKDVAAQTGATILVEPGVNSPVTAAITRQPVDAALKAIVGDQGPVWAKVEIVHRADVKVPAVGLYDLVRAFNTFPSDRMSVAMAGGGGTVTLSRGGTVASAPPVKADEVSVTEYVVAKRTAGVTVASSSGDAVVDQYAQSTQQRQEMFQQMSPEQRSKALQQDIMSRLQMSPEARQQMRQDMRAAWQSLPDEVRQQIQQQRGNRGRGRNRNDGTPRTNQPRPRP